MTSVPFANADASMLLSVEPFDPFCNMKRSGAPGVFTNVNTMQKTPHRIAAADKNAQTAANMEARREDQRQYPGKIRLSLSFEEADFGFGGLKNSRGNGKLLPIDSNRQRNPQTQRIAERMVGFAVV